MMCNRACMMEELLLFFLAVAKTLVVFAWLAGCPLVRFTLEGISRMPTRFQ